MTRAAVVPVLLAVACATFQRGEGLDPASVPPELRGDYQLFAHRCSRCHSLARPLMAHVDDPAHWAAYVERMRRQPASGIAPEDVPGILRFLTWYSASRRPGGAGGASGPTDGGTP